MKAILQKLLGIMAVICSHYANVVQGHMLSQINRREPGITNHKIRGRFNICAVQVIMGHANVIHHPICWLMLTSLSLFS